MRHGLHDHFHRHLERHARRGRRFADRPRGRRRGWHEDDSIEELEEYQRDLEQRVADVAERIRRLQAEEEEHAARP